MFDISGRKVTIVGGKRSGMALAKLVVRQKGNAKVSEHGPEDSLSLEFKTWAKQNGVSLEFNAHTQSFIEDSDMVVLSPGVRFDAPPVQWAKAKGILILGEIEFAYQFCRKPVIAVTGSNGKTTTVNLIANVLREAGYGACLCGNVGTPFSQSVLDLADVDYVLLEISSFQLESLVHPKSPFRRSQNKNLQVQGFKPFIGIILNFSQNHLDRHKDLQEYLDAKKNLFLNQGPNEYALLNDQSSYLRDIAKDLKSQVIFFNDSKSSLLGDIKNPNHMAVMAAARILGIKSNICRKIFLEFKGVEHRLELVRSLDGVDFINDSKATTAEAGRWALSNIDKPILMICGGKDKNIDFSVLRNIVKEKVKKMFVIGEAKAKLHQTFEGCVAIEECDNLEKAVSGARIAAHRGDCVLLTPMCASFDMFRDYEHRGKAYKDIVKALA